MRITADTVNGELKEGQYPKMPQRRSSPRYGCKLSLNHARITFSVEVGGLDGEDERCGGVGAAVPDR
jgi:hypothetical protein